MALIVKIADCRDNLEKCFNIRYKVFVEEFKFMKKEDCPDEMEIDEYDGLDTTTHFIALHDNVGVATARLVGPPAKSLTDEVKMFGIPMESHYNLTEYKNAGITPYEISRSSIIKNERSSRIIMEIWKISILYAQKNGISVFCSCAGTETDSYEDVQVIYELLKVKDLIHPKIRTEPVTENEEIKPKLFLYGDDVKKEILIDNKLDKDSINEYESRKVRLPATLEYFSRIGAIFTGPPVLFSEFKMYTMPMILELDKLKEPFKTFFERESNIIKL